MKITKTAIPEVLVIEPEVYGDDRGFFLRVLTRKTGRAAREWNVHLFRITIPVR